MLSTATGSSIFQEIILFTNFTIFLFHSIFSPSSLLLKTELSQKLPFFRLIFLILKGSHGITNIPLFNSDTILVLIAFGIKSKPLALKKSKTFNCFSFVSESL
jgi:hypothetical protein